MSYSQDEGFEDHDFGEDEIPYWELQNMVVAMQKEILELRTDINKFCLGIKNELY